jgi:hypothetical protein
MKIPEQIDDYIESQIEAKRSDLKSLHASIQQVMPGCRLWFLDGKDENGRTVSNPNIGYGLQQIAYTDGRTREFYQIGLSANTTGMSVYILGIADKQYLKNAYGKTIGKASVTGYCIKFKALNDIDIDVLKSAIRYGVAASA